MSKHRKDRRRAAAGTLFALLALALAACSDPGRERDGDGHDHDHGREEGHAHDEAHGHDHEEGGHDEHGHGEHGHGEQGHDEHGHDEHGHGEHGHGEQGPAVTVISAAEAEEAGVRTERAGPATIVETIDVLGRVDFAPDARASLRARFPGRVHAVFKTVGDTVKQGDLLARVESNESLQVYGITAPMDGVILERNANRGDITGEAPLFRIGNLERLHVDFHVFASDLARVRPQQKVRVQSTDGRAETETVIAAFLPTREAATQTVIARAPLPNPQGVWIPGTTVKGSITVAETGVPLAVRTPALQRFRGGTVVFVREGERYEARELRIGRRTREWTEVLDGLEAGETYVTENSFLIKADIEKSGAAHEH